MVSESDHILGASTVREHVPMVTFPLPLEDMGVTEIGHVVRWAIDEDDEEVLVSRRRDWYRSEYFRDGRFTEYPPKTVTEDGIGAVPRPLIEDREMIDYGDILVFIGSRLELSFRICRVIPVDDLDDELSDETINELIPD